MGVPSVAKATLLARFVGGAEAPPLHPQRLKPPFCSVWLAGVKSPPFPPCKTPLPFSSWEHRPPLCHLDRSGVPSVAKATLLLGLSAGLEAPPLHPQRFTPATSLHG